MNFSTFKILPEDYRAMTDEKISLYIWPDGWLKREEYIPENQMTNEQIYRHASETWGTVAQLIVAVEELAELQQAIIKAIRTGQPSDNLAEEIADVEIMIEQIKFIFPNLPIEPWKAAKLTRLENKLKNPS